MGAPSLLKRIILGRPMSSGEMEHTLLPKTIALPVFSSDPLSSVAYATQEILLVLSIAGTVALSHVVPISFAVSALLAIVVVSYRQTVRAYPTGGGAYLVTKENLGQKAGLLAGSALLIDYVMTVAVSTVAGVDAIVSAAHSLEPQRVMIALGFVVFVALMNLRGVKEAGTFFAVPTYGFVLCIFILLATGFVKCLGGCPVAESAGDALHATGTVTVLLLLRGFAAGTTALTGVEAISDGVPAFRYPQSRNAATTLTIMGAMSISMFLGISWLARQMQVVHTEESTRTVLAEIAHTAFGGGAMFIVVQVMTAAILVLAANTAFQDFPRLSSILARDRFMPGQFKNRGDRLVFSNGVVILSLTAGALIVIFNADLNRLIQLYLVGVFVSFTFSQMGMVLHWRKVKGKAWKRSAAINAFGASVTGIVLMVVLVTKFSRGAWIVVVWIPFLIWGMSSVHKHYLELQRALAHPDRVPADRRPGNQHMVIYVQRVDAAAARAVGYARAIRSQSLIAVTGDASNAAAWRRLAPEIPIETLPRGPARKVLATFLSNRSTSLEDEGFLTLMVPEVLRTRSVWEILLHPSMARLKASLLQVPGLQVLNIPIVQDEIRPDVDEAHEPGRNIAVVLVSGVHNATLQAIEFAESLRPADIRGLSFGTDPEETEKLGNEWLEARIPHPLEIEAAPFRDIGPALVNYLRQYRADGIERVITVVIPEFVVSKRRHQILHNQTALVIKRRLLFETGVAVASVPYYLEER